MISYISSWAQGIIVAVIVASIIEMILPNGTSKKYIKVVIGIYILFNIITPIINKVSSSNRSSLDVSKFLDLDTYVKAEDKTNTNNIDKKNEENIKQIYISKLKNDIKNKLKDMDYAVKNIQIYLENDENYTIKNIILMVTKDNKENNIENENNSKIKEIKEVNIVIENTQNNNINNNSSNNNTSSITETEKKEIKEYLNKTYNIKVQNINIS